MARNRLVMVQAASNENPEQTLVEMAGVIHATMVSPQWIEYRSVPEDRIGPTPSDTIGWVRIPAAVDYVEWREE